VKAISDIRLPKFAKELRRLLSMINTYRFLPNAIQHQTPLNQLFPGNTKNYLTPITLTAATVNNFDECKRTLKEATLIVHSTPTVSLHRCKRFRSWSGTTLCRLSETQRKYSTCGRRYDRKKPDKASPRKLRQLDFISQFTTSLVHVAQLKTPPLIRFPASQLID